MPLLMVMLAALLLLFVVGFESYEVDEYDLNKRFCGFAQLDLMTLVRLGLFVTEYQMNIKSTDCNQTDY